MSELSSPGPAGVESMKLLTSSEIVCVIGSAGGANGACPRDRVRRSGTPSSSGISGTRELDGTDNPDELLEMAGGAEPPEARRRR